MKTLVFVSLYLPVYQHHLLSYAQSSILRVVMIHVSYIYTHSVINLWKLCDTRDIFHVYVYTYLLSGLGLS